MIKFICSLHREQSFDSFGFAELRLVCGCSAKAIGNHLKFKPANNAILESDADVVDVQKKAFEKWYESQERMFYTSMFNEDDIASSAWYAGIEYEHQRQPNNKIKADLESGAAVDDGLDEGE